jgi:hemin uptake protein HemP
MPQTLDRHPEADSPQPVAAEIRVAPARELLGPVRLLRIEHNGEIYTLRVTRNDRLILTK